MKSQITKSLDYLGISSATLCLVHCLVLPFISIIPIGISHNHWIDLLFASIGLFAVVKIVKTNTLRYIKIILLVAMSIILLSIIYTIITHNHTLFLYVGGIGMIVGHVLNFKRHKH
ncbi:MULTISPECIES: MerC domain-containing protein [Flavobacterium]|uniref:MerC domain-containing protein n=1 Tax=Flavobacterium jumunjinense TaxID=998845 RepID=A0ABV5GMU5_9FLAO|nr:MULTISPECIES: MerC domain-containing protein [Flavobacterium]